MRLLGVRARPIVAPAWAVPGVVLGILLGVCGFSAAAMAESETFTYTGEQQEFEVPSRVGSVQVEAVGGAGASGYGGALGGAGAVVSGTVSVHEGQILYVEVGGPGKIGAAAFNGGASSLAKVPELAGGGGGGASDVRTVSIGAEPSPGDEASLRSRLLVAGGGGGGGSTAAIGLKCGESGKGGGAGSSGANGASCGYPGGGGGGAGGEALGGGGGAGYEGPASSPSRDGVSGVLGGGGDGRWGGGGGGGLYGGGGGGYQSESSENCEKTCYRDEGGAGGGGGGSNFVPHGGSAGLAGAGEVPSIVITYSVPKAACSMDAGSLTLSPGLTDRPAVQTIKIKGKLTGCSGATFTAAAYSATLKTAGSVSCAVLASAGEAASGSAKYKWTPKAKASSGSLDLLLSEEPEVAFSGEVTSGPYSPLALSGTVTESYAGAATCGQAAGKKAAKAIKRGTFRGSAVELD